MVRRPILAIVLLALVLAPAALLAQDISAGGAIAGTVDPDGAAASSTSSGPQSVTASLDHIPTTPETSGTIDPDGLTARPAPDLSLTTLATWIRVFLPL